MNKVLIVGRIVKDPEIKFTSSNIEYVRFMVAVKKPFNTQDSDFVPMIAWRNQANFVKNFLKKGALVSVEGRFESYTYQNNENQNITIYEVNVDRINSLESRQMRELREQQSMNNNQQNNNQNMNNVNNGFNSNEKSKDSFMEKQSNSTPATSKMEKQPKDSKNQESQNNNDIDWEIDL